ncbi:teichuronic acid biosynthesis protein TuaB [Bacillus marinisedimentorum]|uniref:teichuronic acid biosynthesis protein TuaB n=1 Tax=Bacillus marinisedimentorum TaxID=1821260 RepID=UPI0014716D34|nr:MOP flippase family protein [Bacillus marinisedimentorum]
MMKQMVGGFKWTGLSSAVVTGVQLLQYVILARLLTPSDFGLMGMIIVIIGFAQVFTDAGVGTAIIQRKSVTRNELSSLYWLNVFLGFLVFSGVILLAPAISNFYNQPNLEELIHYIAFIFLIIPFGQQFQYLIQRNLQFNLLARIEMVSFSTGVLASIILAVLDFGVMSLIWGQIITNATKTIQFTIHGWKHHKPSFHFRFKEITGYLNFGLNQMGSRIVSYFASNVDYMLIGRYLGSEALGIYTVAYQLIVIPVSKINPIITKVAYPVFSKEQDNNKTVGSGFIQISKLLSVVTFPLLVGMMATSPVLVPVVFGDKWLEAAPLIQILALLGILRVLMNPNGSVLLAKGRAGLVFVWDFFVAASNGLVFWYFVQYGTVAVAWAYVAISMVNFILGRFLLHYVIRLDNRLYFRALLKPVIINISMGLLVYGMYITTKGFMEEYVLIQLILLVAVGVITYITLFMLIDKPYLNNVKRYLFKGKKIRPQDG